MSVREELHSSIEAARRSEAFKNYLYIRDRVVNMLEEVQKQANHPSDYWKEELAGFDYILDASPLIIQKLREHCYHLTGLRSYDYRTHHAQDQHIWERKVQLLQELDDDNLLVPESPILGGFGHAVNGSIINFDTLKFYRCLIALNKAGLLAPFRKNDGERKIIIEIGAGWGGFAFQFKTLCPNTCYIIIDLPQTLLFSGVYLKTLFPEASVLIYGDKPVDRLLDGYESYDFIFLPSYYFENMKLFEVDLAVNMASFQEMTSQQVYDYVRMMAEFGCPSLYSYNRDRSPHNSQLSTVRSIIGKYYNVTEIVVPRVDLFDPVLKVNQTRIKPIKIAKAFTRKLLPQKNEIHQERSVHEYRHLVGTRKL